MVEVAVDVAGRAVRVVVRAVLGAGGESAENAENENCEQSRLMGRVSRFAAGGRPETGTLRREKEPRFIS